MVSICMWSTPSHQLLVSWSWRTKISELLHHDLSFQWYVLNYFNIWDFVCIVCWTTSFFCSSYLFSETVHLLFFCSFSGLQCDWEDRNWHDGEAFLSSWLCCFLLFILEYSSARVSFIRSCFLKLISYN